MSFWGDHRWEEGFITPFDPAKLKDGCYRLAMGPEAIVSSSDPEKRGAFQDLTGTQNFITLSPGQFAYLLTEETVSIPEAAIGFMNVKTEEKYKGLLNISGFHVDPNYSGRLIFTVFNAGPSNIAICRGDAIFRIWLSDLEGAKPHQRAPGITNLPREWVEKLQGVYPSPFALRANVEKLEKDVKDIQDQRKLLFVALTVIGVFLAPFMAALYAETFGPVFHSAYEKYFSKDEAKPNAASIPSKPATPGPSAPPP